MGFEPTTSAVTGRRSNQLSHRAILKGLHLQNCTLESLLSFLLFNRLPQTTGQAFDLLVPVSSTHYCASTSGLSTT